MQNFRSQMQSAKCKMQNYRNPTPFAKFSLCCECSEKFCTLHFAFCTMPRKLCTSDFALPYDSCAIILANDDLAYHIEEEACVDYANLG